MVIVILVLFGIGLVIAVISAICSAHNELEDDEGKHGFRM